MLFWFISVQICKAEWIKVILYKLDVAFKALSHHWKNKKTVSVCQIFNPGPSNKLNLSDSQDDSEYLDF